MANDTKSSKSFGSGGKKRPAAKQAAKRQQKSGSKFKNAEIRAALDSQTHILYSINKGTVNLRETRPSDEPMQTLTAILRDL